MPDKLYFFNLKNSLCALFAEKQMLSMSSSFRGAKKQSNLIAINSTSLRGFKSENIRKCNLPCTRCSVYRQKIFRRQSIGLIYFLNFVEIFL